MCENTQRYSKFVSSCQCANGPAEAVTKPEAKPPARFCLPDTCPKRAPKSGPPRPVQPYTHLGEPNATPPKGSSRSSTAQQTPSQPGYESGAIADIGQPAYESLISGINSKEQTQANDQYESVYSGFGTPSGKGTTFNDPSFQTTSTANSYEHTNIYTPTLPSQYLTVSSKYDDVTASRLTQDSKASQLRSSIKGSSATPGTSNTASVVPEGHTCGYTNPILACRSYQSPDKGLRTLEILAGVGESCTYKGRTKSERASSGSTACRSTHSSTCKRASKSGASDWVCRSNSHSKSACKGSSKDGTTTTTGSGLSGKLGLGYISNQFSGLTKSIQAITGVSKTTSTCGSSRNASRSTSRNASRSTSRNASRSAFRESQVSTGISGKMAAVFCSLASNVREPLAAYQERSSDLGRDTQIGFVETVTALGRVAVDALITIFVMFTNLFPIIQACLLIARFFLDKCIEICGTEGTRSKVIKGVLFVAELAIVILIFMLMVSFIVMPVWQMIGAILSKAFGLANATQGKAAGGTVEASED